MGKKNPLNEYKREGFDMFAAMLERIDADVTEYLFKAQIANANGNTMVEQRSRRQRVVAHRGSLPGEAEDGETVAIKTVRRQGEKVGRNAPCPCGSGKKYKKCCGA
jgi:preprotein translocase subunit SecA